LETELGRLFQLEDEVRDNETDLAGVVNHAHYLNYMANARHKHLRQLGLDFQEMLVKGYMLVATKIEIRYKLPLFVGERYCVVSKLKSLRSKVFDFEHTVLRLPDKQVAARATVQAACVDCQSNQVKLPDELLRQFEVAEQT
jgi:YbgC/YbaW family acyl-CoA thioester hydrolase